MERSLQFLIIVLMQICQCLKMEFCLKVVKLNAHGTEVGSTFKMVVLLAALEKAVISSNNRIFCTGYMELGNSRFHCWKKNGHGLVDAKNAITQSCDVYFYEVARRTGIEHIAAMARRLGFGMPLGID